MNRNAIFLFISLNLFSLILSRSFFLIFTILVWMPVIERKMSTKQQKTEMATKQKGGILHLMHLLKCKIVSIKII